MAEKIPSISKINELFQNKEMKPSELFEQVYETASYTESVLHAHLELFYDEGLKCLKSLIIDIQKMRVWDYSMEFQSQ